MALTQCSNCSGIVSTKAKACPHCRTTTFQSTTPTSDTVDSEPPSLQPSSLPISAQCDGKLSHVASASNTENDAAGNTSSNSEGIFWAVYVIVVGVVWYNLGMRFGGMAAAAIMTIKNGIAQSKQSSSDTDTPPP
jgi:hypothetical protein